MDIKHFFDTNTSADIFSYGVVIEPLLRKR